MSGASSRIGAAVRSLAIAMAALSWLGAAHAQVIVSPSKGSALRSDILNALRPAIAREIGGHVSFVVHTLRVMDRWAYVSADPVRPDGHPIDWRTTKFRRDVEADMFSGLMLALLRRSDAGQWAVADYALGPTDVAWVEWIDKHKVPEALFKSE